MKLSRYVGDRAFYHKLFGVMTPVLVQNVITNFVSLLDNVMVGQVGTEPMSGVAIVNQLIFVFNLCIFGGLAGPGIFTAQFYGKGDHEGVRSTFRLKTIIALCAVTVFLVVFTLFGEPLIMQFLHEGDSGLDLEATLGYGKQYLAVMLLQLLPFAVMQIYASTLRETGETMLPMKAGIIAVFVNLVFNYIFIFGKFGFPAMGVVGAAIATVIARFVECGIMVVWTHRHKYRNPFAVGVYRTLKVPKALAKSILITGAPLLANELLWSVGMTTLNQCYSTRGLEVVSAVNISSTISNLFFCAFFAMGSAVSIIIGQLLGAGRLEQAVDEDRKLIAFAVALSAVVGLAMSILAPFIPEVYNTTDSVKAIAKSLLLVSACLMPVRAFTNCCYFTLRTGGKTVITFLFDCCYIWAVCLHVALVLSRLTDMPILQMYICIEALEIIKCIIGFFFVKSKTWVKNLVQD